MRTTTALVLGCATWLAAGAATARDWVSADQEAPEGTGVRVFLLDRDDEETTLRFDIAGLWTAPRETVLGPTLDVTLPRGGSLRQLGRPALPTAAGLVAVPADAALEVELLDVDVVWLDAAAPPSPARPHPTRSDASTAWPLDDALYASADTWPETPVIVEGPVSLRGVAAARVELRAARYDFATGRLGVVRSATVRLHHRGARAVPASHELDSPVYARLIADTVLGYELPPDGIPPVPEAMLVIAEEALLEAVQPWVDWKRQRGLQVTVLTLEELGSTVDGVQGAIDDAYATWDPPVSYVVLVGDGVPTNTGQYDGCASDYLFSNLEGDLLPEVMISRVVGATVDEVATQTAKFIAYERDLPAGEASAWLGRATGAATNESGGGPTDEQRFDAISDALVEAGYEQVDHFYLSDDTGTASNVQAAIDEGRGWLVYLGHGSGYDFSSLSPPYTVAHVAQQSNEGMWPYVTDCSCLNGGFQVPGDDCMDEALMKHGTPEAPMGALGVFGSSTSTSWDPAGEIAEGTSYGVLRYDQAVWGATALYGREHVYTIYGDSMDTEWLFEQWVLFGDASEMIRTRSPRTPEVDYPAGLPLGESEFTVTVAVDGQPVEGATVALHKEGEWDLVTSTDSAGEATFTLSPARKGPVEVVVTDRDLETHVGSSEAGAAGGFGSGCAAAASPFSYDPLGAGFTAALLPGSPLGGAAGLGLLSLVAAARLRRRWCRS